MEKQTPQKLPGVGVSVLFNNTILGGKDVNCQAINSLRNSIEQRELTNLLELLESVGINGDFALIVISCFSREVVV